VARDRTRLVVTHERPVEDSDWPCEHALHRLRRERLRVGDPFDGHRLWAADVAEQDWRLHAARTIRLHQAGLAERIPTCVPAASVLDDTGIGDDPKGPLFRTIGRGTGRLSATPLPQANAHAMVRRRASAAGIATAIGNHTFRATGITAYLKNGGTLENAAAMANHASTRTTDYSNTHAMDYQRRIVNRVRFSPPRDEPSPKHLAAGHAGYRSADHECAAFRFLLRRFRSGTHRLYNGPARQRKSRRPYHKQTPP
jgi:hypothetical protein